MNNGHVAKFPLSPQHNDPMVRRSFFFLLFRKRLQSRADVLPIGRFLRIRLFYFIFKQLKLGSYNKRCGVLPQPWNIHQILQRNSPRYIHHFPPWHGHAGLNNQFRSSSHSAAVQTKTPRSASFSKISTPDRAGSVAKCVDRLQKENNNNGARLIFSQSLAWTWHLTEHAARMLSGRDPCQDSMRTRRGLKKQIPTPCH